MLGDAFGKHKIPILVVRPYASGITPDLIEVLPASEGDEVEAEFRTPLYFLLFQILGSYFAYVFGK